MSDEALLTPLIVTVPATLLVRVTDPAALPQVVLALTTGVNVGVAVIVSSIASVALLHEEPSLLAVSVRVTLPFEISEALGV